MNKKNKFVWVPLVLTMALLNSCGGSDEPDPSDDVSALLQTKTWAIDRVTIDGVDHTDLFSGMTLRFTTSQFTTTHGGAVWPASGTWFFTAPGNETFIRNDDIEVSIEQATESSLVLELHWPENMIGPGRSKSIEGIHRFEFD